ncbi:hypothetical protein [Microbulbifer sp. JMSA003]|uniref:hypothetical protein n=1 Tax=Microbulbifer sp. JMSA003 TaxID=3243369 RepID=UPI0040392EFB
MFSTLRVLGPSALRTSAHVASVKHPMDIIELHDLISEVIESLPEQESRELIALCDSLEELGPNEWSIRIAKFSNRMLLNNIGDTEKLLKLEAEAENVRSIEIKPIYLLLLLVIVALVVYYV